ncbi:2,3-diaminopropionate biosynthesis protein SbnB [Actinoplanes missouriensis]|uniref:2,3-diaminopropionate biosynthesis protein SbnB n=1 Tax=Actinoplanes missouriensis TaxID=1866 RepID=UPI0033F57BA1
MPRVHAPSFAIISGSQVKDVLGSAERAVTGIVEDVYMAHGKGDSVNPPSYFLRFPDRPESRIIALPASLGGAAPVDGIKWISSFPGNVATGLPRASAVLILNDPATGYPIACLESSIISAARTAASAALAADRITAARGVARPRRVGFIGTGLIARFAHTYLAGNGWEFDEVGVHDLIDEHAAGFAGYLSRSDAATPVRFHESAQSLIEASDLVVLATVAGAPHIADPAWFAHAPLVLHLSLRDLSPEVILAAANVVDDVEHCLKAQTSVHLTEQQVGNRDFLAGTLFDVMTGAATVPADRPVVFSPFGLGVLDLGVGRFVYDQVLAAGRLDTVDDFYAELERYG